MGFASHDGVIGWKGFGTSEMIGRRLREANVIVGYGIYDVPLAGALYSYPWFSIPKTFVILRMSDAHPYGKMDMLRDIREETERLRYVGKRRTLQVGFASHEKSIVRKGFGSSGRRSLR